MTDIGIKLPSDANAEMEIYREEVAAAMAAAAAPPPPPPASAPPCEVLFNRSPEHASIIVEYLFLAAHDEINILSSRLDLKVYTAPGVVDAAVLFLQRNPAARINILVECDVDPTSHRWLRAVLAAGADRVSLWRVPEKVSSLYPFNFAVSDRKHYRLERDRAKFEAFAQFGNGKFGIDLDNIFADIKRGSTPIQLH